MSSRILVMLILASFLVASGQASQDSESLEFSAESSTDSSVFSGKKIIIDLSKMSPDFSGDSEEACPEMDSSSGIDSIEASSEMDSSSGNDSIEASTEIGSSSGIDSIEASAEIGSSSGIDSIEASAEISSSSGIDSIEASAEIGSSSGSDSIEASVEIGNSSGMDSIDASPEIGSSSGIDSIEASIEISKSSGMDSIEASAEVGNSSGIDSIEASAEISSSSGMDSIEASTEIGSSSGIDSIEASVEIGNSSGMDSIDASPEIGSSSGIDSIEASIEISSSSGMDSIEASAEVGNSSGIDSIEASAEISSSSGMDSIEASPEVGSSSGIDSIEASAEIGSSSGMNSIEASPEVGSSSGIDSIEASIEIGSSSGIDSIEASAEISSSSGIDSIEASADIDVSSRLGEVEEAMPSEQFHDLNAPAIPTTESRLGDWLIVGFPSPSKHEENKASLLNENSIEIFFETDISSGMDSFEASSETDISSGSVDAKMVNSNEPLAKDPTGSFTENVSPYGSEEAKMSNYYGLRDEDLNESSGKTDTSSSSEIHKMLNSNKFAFSSNETASPYGSEEAKMSNYYGLRDEDLNGDATESSAETDISSGSEDIKMVNSNQPLAKDPTGSFTENVSPYGSEEAKMSNYYGLRDEDLNESSGKTDTSSSSEIHKMLNSNKFAFSSNETASPYGSEEAKMSNYYGLRDEDLNGDFTESSGETDISSGSEEAKMSNYNEPNDEDSNESAEINISSGSGEAKMSDYNEPLTDDSTEDSTESFSEPDFFSGSGEGNVTESPATSTIKSNLFLDVSTEEVIASSDDKSIESFELNIIPASSQNSKPASLTDNELTTSDNFVDSSESLGLPEKHVADASKISKLVSNTESQEKKTNFGVLMGVSLGATVGTVLLATVVFLLYRKRKNDLFARKRLFDDRNEPEINNSAPVLPTYCP